MEDKTLSPENQAKVARQQVDRLSKPAADTHGLTQSQYTQIATGLAAHDGDSPMGVGKNLARDALTLLKENPQMTPEQAVARTMDAKGVLNRSGGGKLDADAQKRYEQHVVGVVREVALGEPQSAPARAPPPAPPPVTREVRAGTGDTVHEAAASATPPRARKDSKRAKEEEETAVGRLAAACDDLEHDRPREAQLAAREAGQLRRAANLARKEEAEARRTGPITAEPMAATDAPTEARFVDEKDVVTGERTADTEPALASREPGAMLDAVQRQAPVIQLLYLSIQLVMVPWFGWIVSACSLCGVLRWVQSAALLRRPAFSWSYWLWWFAHQWSLVCTGLYAVIFARDGAYSCSARAMSIWADARALDGVFTRAYTAVEMMQLGAIVLVEMPDGSERAFATDRMHLSGNRGAIGAIRLTTKYFVYHAHFVTIPASTVVTQVSLDDAPALLGPWALPCYHTRTEDTPGRTNPRQRGRKTGAPRNPTQLYQKVATSEPARVVRSESSVPSSAGTDEVKRLRQQIADLENQLRQARGEAAVLQAPHYVTRVLDGKPDAKPKDLTVGRPYYQQVCRFVQCLWRARLASKGKSVPIPAWRTHAVVTDV